MDYLKKAYAKGDIVFSGKSLSYEINERFKALIDRLYKKEWFVYCRKPFAGPEKVLDYLGRYTFRTAISNKRIKSIAAGRVTFAYRDTEGMVTGKKRSPFLLMNLSGDSYCMSFPVHICVSDTMDFWPTATGKKI